jgi:hypothetical protein
VISTTTPNHPLTPTGASGTNSPEAFRVFRDRPGAFEWRRADDAEASIEGALRSLDAGRIDLAREARNAAREALSGAPDAGGV